MLAAESFAAFVMTYERPQILLVTLNKIISQSRPPQKILIVDNSTSIDTRDLILSLNNPSIEYYRVGYNSGPAGAACIGLEKLSAQGFNWIYWGDDDDAPGFSDSFEILLNLINSRASEKIGMVGAVGQYVNRHTGNIVRVSDDEIRKREFLSVDVIAGGQTMIVNAQLIKKGLIPNKEFFFSFEDLDICLKAKNAGFEILVPSILFSRLREKYNRFDLSSPLYQKKEGRAFIRQYYSTRNMILILKSNKLYSAVTYQIIKSMMKLLYGFRFGFNYGKENFKAIGRGLVHGIINKQGKFL